MRSVSVALQRDAVALVDEQQPLDEGVELELALRLVLALELDAVVAKRRDAQRALAQQPVDVEQLQALLVQLVESPHCVPAVLAVVVGRCDLP